MAESEKYAGREEELLLQIAAQDQGALEVLVKEWTPKLFSFCFKILRDSHQTEEVVQDCFLKVWSRASSYSPEKGRGASWIFSIAHHHAIDRLRTNRSRGAYLASPSADLATFAPAAPQGVAPWQKLRMEQALAALSSVQRQALELSYFEGLTGSEIAQRLGEPLGTVKTRLRDALIKLKRIFRNPGDDLQSEAEKLSLSCQEGKKS